MSTVGILGTLTNFDPKTSEFAVFGERLSQFFVANEIKDVARKKAVLLNTLNEESYVLINILTAHFKPVKSYFSERMKLYRAIKLEGEKVYAKVDMTLVIKIALAKESALAERAVREALPGMSQTSIRIENEADMHFSRQQQNIASSAGYNQPHGSYQQKNRLEIQRSSQSDVGSSTSGRGRIQPNKIQGLRQKLTVVNGKVVFCGDFNVNLSADTSYLLTSFNLSQTVDSPNRIDENSATCIGNIFVNFDVLLIENIDNGLFNDFYQKICLDFRLTKDGKSIFKRFYSQRNIDNFKHENAR
ncbi:hypothetical protein JTB14_000349 [Gonioctena quinquepunctata]|nr:hypothetical protein JTB14_000349 [Gonioctena quinquepunctata]